MKPNMRILINPDLVYFQSEVKKFDVLVRLTHHYRDIHSLYYIFGKVKITLYKYEYFFLSSIYSRDQETIGCE